eukprot:Rhum_TRINITY_DN15294_c3_g2::Rhum_TRINITY_DN15294_c3_g2_i1::g.148580::m.148580
MAAHRSEVLRMYKELLRLAAAMPTKGRRGWMRDKVQTSFRTDMHVLKDPEEIEHRLAVARAQIENATVVSKHLSRWLGRDDEPYDPLDFSCPEPNQDMLEYNYDYEREWTEWLKLHPRHCQINEAGTPLAIDQWIKMVRNKRVRAELLPPPPSRGMLPSLR